MTNEQKAKRQITAITWHKTHIIRMRSIRRKSYYNNRLIINLMFSKAKSIEPDLADIYFLKRNPNG